MNALFICPRNRLRSPTAERVFFETPGVAVRSAGTERDADNPISSDDVDWAEVIFVMESRHKKRLQQMLGRLLAQKRVIVLGIPDDYEFMQAELVALLTVKVKPHLEASIYAATVTT